MNYAIRNTLIIAAFWSLVLASGFYYVYGYQHKLQERLRQENHAREMRLRDLTRLETDRSELRIHLQRLQDLSLGKMGTLSAHESPGETYDYILRELERTRSRLAVSFTYKNEDLYLTLKRRYYDIKGSGTFLDFYELLWFLENGPVFYNVRRLEVEPQLTKSGYGRSEDVAFSLEVNGYERQQGPDIAEIRVKEGDYPPIVNLVKGRPQRLFRDVAAPAPGPNAAIQSAAQGGDKPRPNTGQLPEIDHRTQVMAIMPGSAVVKDHSGRTFRLKTGDRIYNGSVDRIDAATGTIQFSLEGGAGGVSTLVLPARTN